MNTWIWKFNEDIKVAYTHTRFITIGKKAGILRREYVEEEDDDDDDEPRLSLLNW